ncbi:hypothetical protein Dimus_012356 [Dionaea muscipula]
MEVGQSSSGSNPSDDVWAQLVPSNSGYPNVEIRSRETLIRSEVTSTSSDKREWCQITRNSDLCSATLKNTSPNMILVDGISIQKDGVAGINCGSEIVPGSSREAYSFISSFACFMYCSLVNATMVVLHTKDILLADASLRRSAEELATLDKYASIKSNLAVCSRTRSSRKRAHSVVSSESEDSTLPYDESSDVELLEFEYPCRQCGSEYGGFRCSESTIHLQCQGCGGTMPSRSDITIPQHCLGCDGAFCGAYWRAQGVSGNDYLPFCYQDPFKCISERTISRIPFPTHESNLYEQEVCFSVMQVFDCHCYIHLKKCFYAFCFLFVDHKKVYNPDGKDIAGCCFRVGCKVGQERNR